MRKSEFLISTPRTTALMSVGADIKRRIFGGGCYFDPAAISSGQVLLTEFVCAWMVV